ncbi:MAG: ATP-dependent helicase HrpB [Kiritimatiellales bacterium]
MNRNELPIYELHAEIIAAVRETNRLIIEAPTGSGKSTQVPQMLLDSGLFGGADLSSGEADFPVCPSSGGADILVCPSPASSSGADIPVCPSTKSEIKNCPDRSVCATNAPQIVVLQPRRLAARMLARRVAQERSGTTGAEVGYQVRFENCVSEKTRITYVTEGILLRKLLSDPELRDVGAICFDEFHERHLYGDITLARALHLQQIRPDLKIIVMSATLDAAPLRDYLAPCRALKSEGRMFPVEIQYAARRIDFNHQPVWDAAADAFETAVCSGAAGDVLIFMPGAYEISRTVEAVRAKPCAKDFAVMPLHGELSPQDQDAATGNCDRRKVVVATNIAETSITIGGIRIVIDSGLARIARYDPNRGIDTLMIERISRASAAQRTGRAGRTAPGICMRLWTLQEQATRRAQELPEILRHDLSEVVLALKAGGIDDIENFGWLEKPDPAALARTITLLTDLGAIDRAGAITKTGMRMIQFPMHPRYARMLLAADDYHCVRQACLIAALTQGRGILQRNAGRETRSERDELFGDNDVSDFKRLMRAWSFADKNRYDVQACRRLGIHAGAARQVTPLYERFMQIAEQQGLKINRAAPEEESLQRCILMAFSDQLARRCDRGTLRCELVHGRTGELARESAVRAAQLFVAAEITEIGQTRGQTGVLLNLATAVNPEWLEELFPEDFTAERIAKYDPVLKRVVVEHREKFRDLILESSITQNPTKEEAATVLAAEVLKGGIEIPGWTEEIEHWILRVNLLAGWCPDLGIPAIDDAARQTMLEEICYGAVSRKDLRETNVKEIVRSWLPYEQRRWIDEQMPERFTLPTGHRARIRYEAGHKPVLSAMIQDFFGVTKTPAIAFGRVPLVVELLAPNRRPVQKTEDLASFWRTAYPELKPALSRRYPKWKWI